MSFLLIFFLCLLIVAYQLPLAHLWVVYASNSSRVIDLYTQKEPYDGRGLNQASDAFAPQDEVFLYAEAMYNEDPVENRLVAFEIYGPVNPVFNVTLSRTGTTNASGIARVSFRLPWPAEDAETVTFGVWTVYAVVEIAGESVQDTLTFQVGWIVDIVSLVTVNVDLQPQTRFSRETFVGVELGLRNIAMLPRRATLTVVTYDNLSVPIDDIVLNNFEVKPGDMDVDLSCMFSIPVEAALGQAMVRAMAYTAPLADGGVAYCPEASTVFLITWCDVAIVSVVPSATAVDVGDLVNVTVRAVNEGFEMESFDLGVYCNEILVGELQVVDMAPSEEREFTFVWNTSGLAVGDYTVSANASVVPGEIDVDDNLLVDGVVRVGVPGPPQPAFAFPMVFLVVLLAGVGAMVCTMVLAFCYKKREIEKGRSSFSSGSPVGGSGGGGFSKPDERSGGSALSSRSLIAKPKEEKVSHGYRRLEVSSLRKPFVLRPRVESFSMKPLEWSSQKPKEESSSNSSSVAPMRSSGSPKPFVLAVIDLSRLRKKK